MTSLPLGMTFTDLLQLTSVLSSGFFFHGCLFMTLIEHPARKNLPLTAFVMQWRQSCQLTKLVFLPVEIVCLISSLLLYFMTSVEDEYNFLKLIPAFGVLANMTWTVTRIVSDIKRTTEENVERKKDYQWIANTVDTIMKRHNFRIAVGFLVHLTTLKLYGSYG